MKRVKGIYALDTAAFEMIYGPDEQRDIARHVEIYAPVQTRDSLRRNPGILADAEVLLSGWGGPILDAAFLAAAPKLQAVFYGAGATGGILTPAVWERGIQVTSSYAANAVPVAEYTLATILLSLKHFWRLARETRQTRKYPCRDVAPGCYGSTVGLVSVGMIARTLVSRLKSYDLKVIAYDPFMGQTDAQVMGIKLAPIEDVFSQSDVVSIHTPWLPETEGLVTADHVRSMKQGATLINTARGAVMDEVAILRVLAERPDLQAILDVAQVEPPAATSSLYTLENVVLTPHIAGSVGQECRRMGRYMVEELERYLNSQALKWPVTPELAEHSSHRPAALASPAAAKATKAIAV